MLSPVLSSTSPSKVQQMKVFFTQTRATPTPPLLHCSDDFSESEVKGAEELVMGMVEKIMEKIMVDSG